MIRVSVEVTLDHDDVEDLRRLLQLLRTWDSARDSVRMAIAVTAPGLSVETVRAVFDSLTPTLPERLTIPRPPES